MLPRVPSLIWGFSGKKLSKMSQVGDKNSSKEQRQVRYRAKVRRPRGKMCAAIQVFPSLASDPPCSVGLASSGLLQLCTNQSDWVVQLTPSALVRVASIPSSAPSALFRLCSCGPLSCRALPPPKESTLSQCECNVSVLSSVKVEPLHPIMVSFFSELS